MARMSSLRLGVLVAAATAAGVPGVAQAQSSRPPRVDLPRVEIVGGFSFSRSISGTDVDPKWTGPSLATAADVKVTRNIAVATAMETGGRQAWALMTGAQFSTDFFYGSSRDPVPGRFLARMVAGAARQASATVRPAVRLSAGADILLSQRRAVGVRWDAGYEFTLGNAPHRANGRIAVGLIVGPHLRHA